MPDLHQTLRSTDLDFLQRVARAWGFDLSAKSFAAALKEVESHLQDESLLHEILDALPENAKTALDSLLVRQGRESGPFLSVSSANCVPLDWRAVPARILICAPSQQ